MVLLLIRKERFFYVTLITIVTKAGSRAVFG